MEVLVVGAGVSGCACSAALANRGLDVLLVNSAMDRVGLPAYGPDLLGGSGGLPSPREILDRLPAELGAVWQASAWEPAGGEPLLNVDRRSLSVETKRALERIRGLRFRQGFVTGLRLVGGAPRGVGAGGGHLPDDEGIGIGAAGSAPHGYPRVEVETVFGEVFQADALVIAVGLSLGATTSVGAETVPGGRYGEPPSTGLRAALEALGAQFQPVSLDVGERISVKGAREEGWLSDGAVEEDDSGCAGSARGYQTDTEAAHGACTDERLNEEVVSRLVPVAGKGSGRWPEEYPPAPYWRRELRVSQVILEVRAGRPVGVPVLPLLSPDGAVTSEAYFSPGGAVPHGGISRSDEDRAASTRMPSLVAGEAVTGLDEAGRLSCAGEQLPVWVIGRAAGAPDYTSSLASALSAAQDIVREYGDDLIGGLQRDPPAEERKP